MNANLENISALSRITSVGNRVVIKGTSLQSLHGLDQVAKIEEELSISANCQLLTLDGLESLQTVGSSYFAWVGLKLLYAEKFYATYDRF